MRKIANLLILLAFVLPVAAWAGEAKKPGALKASLYEDETPSAYQKLTAEELEWLLKIKGHLNPLQLFPIVNKSNFQFDLGPAQFQFTFPFR